MQVLKTNRLALSYSIAMVLYLVALLVLFRKAAGGINSREIASSVGRVLLAALAMGGAVWGCKAVTDQALHLSDPLQMTTLKLLAQILVCTGVGSAVYLVAVKLLRVPEAEFVLGTVGRRFQRLLGRKRKAA